MNGVVEEKHNFMYDYYHLKLEVFRDIVFRYDYRLDDCLLAMDRSVCDVKHNML